MTRLPRPTADRAGVQFWLETHLGRMFDGPVVGSPSFRGGQRATDAEIMVTLVRLLTHDVVVITMPPVRQTPEAIFVGITIPTAEPGMVTSPLHCGCSSSRRA